MFNSYGVAMYADESMNTENSRSLGGKANAVGSTNIIGASDSTTYINASRMIYADPVARQCARFSRNTGIRVSVHAQFLLKTILDAIVVDPHPRWRVMPGQTQGIRAVFLSTLPNYLQNIVTGEYVETEITSFHLLHWLSINLNSLCIIDKE